MFLGECKIEMIDQLIENTCFAGSKFELYEHEQDDEIQCDLCGEKIKQNDICFRCIGLKDLICTKCANWKVCL